MKKVNLVASRKLKDQYISIRLIINLDKHIESMQNNAKIF